MNSKGHKFFAPAGFFGRRILPVIFLAPLCALLTGCPHNDYTVELKPTAHGVERTLKFYRVDEAFPSNELAAISQVYPAGAVKWESGTNYVCLLYTSDAADDLLCVDLGGRRVIKKKN